MKKVFIFDFDGTFYTSEDKFKFVPQYVDNHRREFLPNVTDEQYKYICAENPDFVKAVSGRDIVIEIYKIKNKYKHLKIDVSNFWQVQQDYVYDICLTNAHFVDYKFIEQLCKRYSVYIVSNSSYNHIKHYMKILKIDYDWFKGVYSNKFEQFDQTKQHYYQDIINAENITPRQLYVFGDSVVCDLEPAKILGANTVFIQDAHDIKKEVEKCICL